MLPGCMFVNKTSSHCAQVSLILIQYIHCNIMRIHNVIFKVLLTGSLVGIIVTPSSVINALFSLITHTELSSFNESFVFIYILVCARHLTLNPTFIGQFLAQCAIFITIALTSHRCLLNPEPSWRMYFYFIDRGCITLSFYRSFLNLLPMPNVI